MQDGSTLRAGVTPYYAGLAQCLDPLSDPIAAQYVPQAREAVTLTGESTDPLDERRYQVTPRLVHRYRDRVLLLVYDRCAVYCRHCFRRHFTGHDSGRITPEEMDAACRYLAQAPAVEEVLLSGGDPLMLSDSELMTILARLVAVKPDLVLRVCTRVPVVLPARITEPLADLLGAQGTVWVVTQANHPRELTPEFVASVRRLLRAGVPVLNQTVLLAGVNDDLATLQALFRGLVRARVKPYYLFQGDLASGTAHWRVPLARGLELVQKLRARLSGMAMPTYAVDLPGGGGKVPIEATLLRTERDAFVFRSLDGDEYRYPREGEPSSRSGTEDLPGQDRPARLVARQ
jgi:lysine 2,3-aminomutase